VVWWKVLFCILFVVAEVFDSLAARCTSGLFGSLMDRCCISRHVLMLSYIDAFVCCAPIIGTYCRKLSWYQLTPASDLRLII